MVAVEVFSIGELAERTGVSVSALRYYDELGLVTTVERVGGQRRFDAGAVTAARFVKRAQRFGFSLEQIGQMMNGADQAWQPLVTSRLEQLRNLRQELDVMIADLERVESCRCRFPTRCGEHHPA